MTAAKCGNLGCMAKNDPHYERKRKALLRFMESRSLKMKPWADSVGLSDGAIRNFLRGRTRSMTHENAKALAEVANSTVEEMFGEGPAQLHATQKRNRVDSLPIGAESFPPGIAAVEQIDMRMGMGAGGQVEAINQTTDGGYVISKDAVLATWGVPDPYLREMGMQGRGVYLFTAHGDSMERPDGGGLHSGDLVMADTHDRRPSPPGIFAIWDGLGAVVKRLEYQMNSEPPMLNVISDNPLHLPKLFAMDEVNIIGRCVWYGRRL